MHILFSLFVAFLTLREATPFFLNLNSYNRGSIVRVYKTLIRDSASSSASSSSLFASSTSTESSSQRKKVVVIGGGFAGLYTCKALSEKGLYDVTLVSPSPRFTFSPLLYELATGDREVDDVSPTLSAVLPPSTTHLEASASSVSFPTRSVSCLSASGSATTLRYDYLVIGSGLRSGLRSPTPDCGNFATLEDALALRRRMEYLTTLQRRPKVAVVGGGYSGVEVALCVKKR